MIKLFKFGEELEDARKFWIEETTEGHFTAKNGITLPYRVYFPKGYTQDMKLPLLFHLHGGSAIGDDNLHQMYYDAEMMQGLFAYENYEPYILVFPQCPPGYFWSCQIHKDELRGLPLTTTPEYPVSSALYELAENLLVKYSCDRSRVYVTGASLGGAGAYEQIYRHSDFYAASIIGCGVSDPDSAPVIAKTPVYIMHGTEDPTISVEFARKIAEALPKYNADFVYKEFPGRIHNFLYAPSGQWDFMEALHWIFQKRR